MTDRATSDVDSLIREALSREEAELFDRLGRPSIHEQITDLFRGQNRWLTLATMAATLIFMIVAVYCGYRFLGTEDVAEMLRWGAGGALAVLAVTMAKIWAWMELQRHATTRELKRLEVQVAHLAGRRHGA